MNCLNCNTPLIPGSDTCPNCGALNMGFNKKEEELETLGSEFVEIDDSEELNITTDMVPPTLNIEDSKDLKANTGDIGNLDMVDTYSPEGVEEVKTPEEIMQERKEEKVEFVIPSSVKPSKEDNIKDGETPIVENIETTIGEKSEDIKVFKIGNKEIKLKMSSKKNVPGMVCLLGIVVFFIIGIMIGSTVFTKNVCVSSPTNIVSNSKLVADGKNNITEVSGFEFKIPKDYKFDKKDAGLLIYDKDAKWRIYIRPVTGLYEDIANAKTSIKASLKENSTNVNQIKELKVNDSNVLVVETTKGVDNSLVAFMAAEKDYVYYIDIVTVDNKYNHDLLTVVEDIAKNASFKKQVSDIEKIDINDIAELVVTTSEAHKSLVK